MNPIVVIALFVMLVMALALYHVLFRFAAKPKTYGSTLSYPAEPKTYGSTLRYQSEGSPDSAGGRAMMRGWQRDIAAMEAEDRIFMVPGRGYVTKQDDVETWAPYAQGLPHKEMILRVEHINPMRDLDYDAVAFCFDSAQDKAIFRTRVPLEGPKAFVFRDTLSDSTRALHDELMMRRR